MVLRFVLGLLWEVCSQIIRHGDGAFGCRWFYFVPRSIRHADPFSNLPIGAVSFIIVTIFLRIKRGQEDVSLSLIEKLRKLDLLGIFFIVSAVSSLILALQWGQEHGNWRQSRVIGCFVGFLLLILTFGLIQWKKQGSATIPLKILQQRSILMGACYLFFLETAIYIVSLLGTDN